MTVNDFPCTAGGNWVQILKGAQKPQQTAHIYYIQVEDGMRSSNGSLDNEKIRLFELVKSRRSQSEALFK